MSTQMQNFCGVLWDLRRRACLLFKRYIEFLFEFDFYMASTRRVNCDMVLYCPQLPFLPTFYFCIAFLGYRLILGILSPWLSVPDYASRIPPPQIPWSWIIASILLHPLSGNTWLLLFIIVIYDRLGVSHGTGGQFTNDSSFPFRTFLQHCPFFPGSGVSDRLVRSAWYSFAEGILACTLSVFLLLPSDSCFSLFFFFLYVMNQLFLRVGDTGLSLGELYPVTIPHSRVLHWWPTQLCTINTINLEQSCLSSTYLSLFSLLFIFWLLAA